MAQKSLEARIRDLEVIHEIMNLEADYAHGIDSRQPDLRAGVFAKDGVFISGDADPVRGRDAIRKYDIESSGKKLSFSIHWMHNPHIVVKGDKAEGRFYFEVALTWAATNEAAWVGGFYEDKFVNTDEGWKIKEKKANILYFTAYDKGWVKEKNFLAQRPR